MADAPKLLGSDTLRKAYPKINTAIDNANEALTKSEEANVIADSAVTTATNAVTTANSAVTTANEANDKSDFTQTQLDEVVGAGTIDPAVEQMKVDLEGVSHPSPDARLRSELQKRDAQLAETTTQINNTKTDLSTNYAKKSDVNSLASNKADKTYVDTITQSLASGSPKGTYATLAALQTAFSTGNTNIYIVSADGKWYYWNGSAWTAGGVYQSTGFANSSVTTPVLSDGAVTLNKTTFNIFPLIDSAWSRVPYTNTVGSAPKYSTNYAEMIADPIRYRHDLSKDISVAPGFKLKIRTPGIFRIAIVELDINGVVLIDSGWLPYDTTYTLSNNTRFIKILVSAKDSSNTSLSAMLASKDIFIEVDYSNLPTITMPTEKNNKENTLNLLQYEWVVRGYTADSNLVIGYNYVENRLSYATRIANLGQKKYYYSVADGYKIGILFANKDNKIAFEPGSKTGSGYVAVPENATEMLVTISRVDEGNMFTSDIHKAKPIIAETEVSELYNTFTLQNKADNRYEAMNLGDKLRFIGHGGTNTYAPENSIEAYKMAHLMDYWGAECDLVITKDNHLVLMHDKTLERTTNGSGNVSDYTLEEIKALNIDINLRGFENVKVPTIEEYLDTCKKYGLYPIIEVKQDDYSVVDILLSVLEKYNIINDCIIISFGIATLQYIREMNNQVKLALIRPVNANVSRGNVYDVLKIGNCALNVYVSDSLTRDMVDMCHAEGVPVFGWTIYDDHQMQLSYDLNLDAVTTDAYIDVKRDRRMINARVIITDGIATSEKSPFGHDVTLNTVDDYTLQIDFGTFYRVAINNFNPLVNVNNMTAAKLVKLEYYVGDGVVCVSFKDIDGMPVSILDLPYTLFDVSVCF